MHRILYLGIDPSRYEHKGTLIHCPVIRTVPRLVPVEMSSVWPLVTHVLFTSPSAVTYWPLSLSGKTLISIGQGTSAKLQKPSLIAPFATQEGVVELLETMDVSNAYFFWPRSSQSRPILEAYFTEKNIRFQVFDLYQTEVNSDLDIPDLSQIDELVFTSPSTVMAFIQLFGSIPFDKKITPIGPVTAKSLQTICQQGLNLV